MGHTTGSGLNLPSSGHELFLLGLYPLHSATRPGFGCTPCTSLTLDAKNARPARHKFQCLVEKFWQPKVIHPFAHALGSEGFAGVS